MSKGFKILIIFIIWWIYNDTSRLFLIDYSWGIALFQQYNLVYVVYISWILNTLLWLFSIYYIIKRHPNGIKTLYWLFGISTFITLVGVILQFMDIDLAKEIFSKSREMRWLQTKNMDQIISPLWLIITSLGYILFYWYLTRYIHKTRSYFSNKNEAKNIS